MFAYRRRDRRGAALVYVCVIMLAMMGLASLSVDLGRYECAHVQLHSAADAAARTAALALSKSGATASSVTTAATTVATANTADGQQITSSMVTVQLITWNDTTHTGAIASGISTANAVRVYLSYSVPTVFAQVLGVTSKMAVESSTAELVKQVDTPTVYATGNPWLAGEPAGTLGSQPDPNWSATSPNPDHRYKNDIAGTPGTDTNGGTESTSTYASYEPYNSPAKIAFTVTPGATVTITNTSGIVQWDHGTSPNTDPSGNSGTNPSYDDAASGGISEHGMADVTMPLGSMVGVFLGSGLPDDIATVPPPLDFSTQAARDYDNLAPKVQQPFYAGTGQTSGGTQQEIVVPANATRLYLGIMDGWEWSNNNGSFSATVTETKVVTVQ
ncbi:MAG TPA: TadG family pilus assembly protein [Tepidisphaeraceae bacterium]|jgi:Flp pilus assembly protein TadG|nr:TadG family pilus assembly protein [Tepidisphaeraceae bacterium]